MYLEHCLKPRASLVAAALVLALGLATTPLGAQTVNPNFVPTSGIGFASLPGPNFAPYSGHTEGAFTVTPTAGSWFQGLFYGDPTPSILDGPTNAPGVGALLISDSAGLFNLTSFRYSSNNGDSSYDVQGFLGASLLFEETGTLLASLPPSFGFQTLLAAHSSTFIDGLIIQVNPGPGVTSINLDNIMVATIPEPGSVGLMLAGLAAIGFCAGANARNKQGT